jgi:hypothetical protein
MILMHFCKRRELPSSPNAAKVGLVIMPSTVHAILNYHQNGLHTTLD